MGMGVGMGELASMSPGPLRPGVCAHGGSWNQRVMDTVLRPAQTLKDQVGTETGMVAFLLGPPSLLTRKPSEKLVWKFCHFQAFLILSCDLLPPFSAAHAPVTYSLYCQPPKREGRELWRLPCCVI